MYFRLPIIKAACWKQELPAITSQVSEVVKLGDVKLLYRLKVDENTLRRRNMTARPTEYMKKVIDEEKKAAGKVSTYQPVSKTDTRPKNKMISSKMNLKMKNRIQLHLKQD